MAEAPKFNDEPDPVWRTLSANSAQADLVGSYPLLTNKKLAAFVGAIPRFVGRRPPIEMCW